MNPSLDGSSRADGFPSFHPSSRDPVYILTHVPPVVDGKGTTAPIQAPSTANIAVPRQGEYFMGGEPTGLAQYPITEWPPTQVHSFANGGPEIQQQQYSLTGGVPAPLQDPYYTYPSIQGQEHFLPPFCWPPYTPPAFAWPPPMQYQPTLAYPGGTFPPYAPYQLPPVPMNPYADYKAESSGWDNTAYPQPSNIPAHTSHLMNVTQAKDRTEFSRDLTASGLGEGHRDNGAQESLEGYLECRMPVTSQAPHTSAKNRPEGFLTVVPRKLYISRPVKWGWTFTAARLREIVRSGIERKHMLHPDSVPAEMFQAPIENIEVPRHSNNKCKGYAIITFKTMNAAHVVFEALTFDGYFNIRRDIFQQDVPSRYINTVLYVAGLPPNFSKDFTLRVVESCIPSTLGRLTYDGLLIHDCILAFECPITPDGICEGDASITFGFEEVAYTVRTALYYRGFLVSFSPIPRGRHAIAKAPMVNEPPPYPSFNSRDALKPHPPDPQMGIFPPTPPEIAHPRPCLSDKQSAQLVAKKLRGKVLPLPSRLKNLTRDNAEKSQPQKFVRWSEMKPPSKFDHARPSTPDLTPTKLEPPPEDPSPPPSDVGYELSSSPDPPVRALDKTYTKRGRTMSL